MVRVRAIDRFGIDGAARGVVGSVAGADGQHGGMNGFLLSTLLSLSARDRAQGCRWLIWRAQIGGLEIRRVCATAFGPARRYERFKPPLEQVLVSHLPVFIHCAYQP